MLIPGDKISVDFHVESDDFCEALHFHFEAECPVCHYHRAGTNYYGSPLDCLNDGGLFSCQECASKFRIITYDACAELEALIEVVSVT